MPIQKYVGKKIVLESLSGVPVPANNGIAFLFAQNVVTLKNVFHEGNVPFLEVLFDGDLDTSFVPAGSVRMRPMPSDLAVPKPGIIPAR